MNNKTILKLILPVLFVVFGQNCEKGLAPIAGFEGRISLPVDSTTGQVIWPDSLTGAVVVIAEFQYPLYTSVDSFFAHIVTYSDPLDLTQPVQDYFLQAPPGVFLGGIVALDSIPIMKAMFSPQDSLRAHPEYFKPLGIYKPVGSTQPAGTISVSEEEITPDIDMQVDFNFVLPF